MQTEKIQKITLKIFFPAMYLCASIALVALWLEEHLVESFFLLIPSFFIIGLAALITWCVAMVVEFRNIAKGKK